MNPNQIIGLDIFWSQPPQQNRPLMTRILPNPIYRTIYINRVTEMISGAFQPDSLFPRIHELADMIQLHVRNDRNKMFSDQDFERGLIQDIQVQQPRRTIIGLERFVRDRRQSVLNQLDSIDFTPPVRINEILADNRSCLADEEEEYEDGLELINMTDHAVNLEGVGLTDEIGGEIWTLPDTTIPADGYIWIWCDGEEDQSPVHAPFRLNDDSEQVLLFAPDGDEVWDFISWYTMPADVSWGRFPDGAPNQRQMQPTPGEPNSHFRQPLFEGTRREPQHPSPEDTVWVITSLLTDNNIEEINLVYRIEGDDEWTIQEMLDDGEHQDNEADDSWFGAMIPPVDAGILVEYYLTALDNRELERSDPVGAPGNLYNYVSVEEWAWLCINEFQASNDSTIADPQGDYDDWIEIYNSGEVRLDLSGLFLTDDLAEPDKWEFPEGVILGSSEFLIVWTDNDEDDTPGLHTTFRLSSDGEQIGLFILDGNLFAAIDTITFGQQQTDYSYGRRIDGGDEWVEFENPTPGESNILFIADTTPGELPDDLKLSTPYPNPFNSQTVIRFSFSGASLVRLAVYDLSGRVIDVIMEDRLTQGEHQAVWDADGYPAGLYFIRLEKGSDYRICKALLVK